MNSPVISIIIPIYKVEKYIHQCIESVINQTYKNLEIILVDDGSPDNCPQICDSFAEKDNRIKVIHKENSGLVSARQAGLKAAAGDYVGFVDGDDWIEPDMYEKIALAIDETNADGAICEFFYSYVDKETKSDYALDQRFYSREDIENKIFPTMLFKQPYYSFGIFPNCWTKVFKKEILRNNLYNVDKRIRLGEDISFTYPCIMDCSSICYVDNALYHYRINPESMTKKYDPLLPDIYFLPYKALTEKCSKVGIDLSAQLPYYLLYLVNFLVRNEAINNNSNYKKSVNRVVDIVLSNKDVIDCVTKIDVGILPKHTKLLALAVNKKSSLLLKSYIKLLRRII